jgi:hypothetical protein
MSVFMGGPWVRLQLEAMVAFEAMVKFEAMVTFEAMVVVFAVDVNGRVAEVVDGVRVASLQRSKKGDSKRPKAVQAVPRL